MDSFVIIYLGMLAIGLMLWATALSAGKSKSKQGGLRDIPHTTRLIGGILGISLRSQPSPFSSTLNSVSLRFNGQTLSEKMVEGRFLLGDGKEIQ
jgi:hypothetical protein